MNSRDDGGCQISDEEKGARASFEIIELSALLAVPEELDVPPGDWLSIAAAGVEYVENGGDPLDGRPSNAFTAKLVEISSQTREGRT